MTPDAPWLSVWVPGEPIPQGSLKAYVRGGRARLVSDNPRLRGWRTEVALAVRAAMLDAHLERIARPDAVHLDITAVLTPPQQHRLFPTVKPDADKLERGVLDALTGIVYDDDAQVVSISLDKLYEAGPGVRLHIWRLANPRVRRGRRT